MGLSAANEDDDHKFCERRAVNDDAAFALLVDALVSYFSIIGIADSATVVINMKLCTRLKVHHAFWKG